MGIDLLSREVSATKIRRIGAPKKDQSRRHDLGETNLGPFVSQQSMYESRLPMLLFQQQHGAPLDTSCEPAACFHHRHFIAKYIDGFVE
jgi:hypothetical protein